MTHMNKFRFLIKNLEMCFCKCQMSLTLSAIKSAIKG